VDEGSKERLRAVGAADGAAYWFLGTLMTVKATGEDTGGAFTMLEQLAPPGWNGRRRTTDFGVKSTTAYAVG
jgi:hypothetical protein